MATNNSTNVSNPMTVSQGGQGNASLTAFAVVCGGSGTTTPLQSIASVGTSGQVLTSNGAGALPTFQAASGGSAVNIGSISGDWYPGSSIWGGVSVSGANPSLATGTLWFVPFFVSKTTVYTQIGVLIYTTAAGTSVMGVYNDSGNGAPTGSPIANSNSTSISNSANTASTYTFSSPISLTPGTYWTAISVSATNTTFGPGSGGVDIGGRGLGIQATPTTTNISAPQCGWSQTFSYSATLPSVGSLTATTCYGNGDMYMFLKAQ